MLTGPVGTCRLVLSLSCYFSLVSQRWRSCSSCSKSCWDFEGCPRLTSVAAGRGYPHCVPTMSETGRSDHGRAAFHGRATFKNRENARREGRGDAVSGEFADLQSGVQEGVVRLVDAPSR